MKVWQIVFSPTGGTRKAAEIITEAWGMPTDIIDISNAETDFSSYGLEKDDIAVIAVPSYGGRVPALAAQRISQIRGNHARCIIVCVYGNRAYEDTLTELYDIAEESGFKIAAAVAAVAEHSIIRRFAEGRPDDKDQNELNGFAERILEKINGGLTEDSAPQIPGNRPYKKAGGASLVPKAGNDCKGCGLCAEKCPAQAINKENPKVTDNKKCIACMRCVAQCPQSARKVNGAMVSAVELALKKACSTRKENELYL